jgi:hypothetical protein
VLYPLGRTLAPTEKDPEWAGQPPMQSEHFEQEKNLLLLPGIETWMVQTVAKSLDQYCPISIPKNTFWGSTIKHGINTHEFQSTANNSKYPSKYGRNLCPLIRNNGIISVHYKLPLCFLKSTHFQRQIEILLQVSYVTCHAKHI